MRALFLEKLIKAAKSGEGSRGGRIVGHTKSGKPIYEKGEARKPYPGEEAWKLESDDVSEPQRKQTFMPPEGTEHHYADTPALRAYKNLMRAFKQKGIPFQGHITYDPKTDKVSALSESGMKAVKEIISDYHKQKGGG